VTPGEALEAAGLAEAEERYRRQLGREMYQAGRRDVEAEMAERWNRIAAPTARRGPDFAELEARRWGPGGREHFADPRPGDYPGRIPAQRQPEPEPQAEPELEIT
jgi:hypothetical protein